MLANSRIDRLRTRAKYEKNSISTKPGAITSGTPLGKKRLKYFIFWIRAPIILIPTKTLNVKYTIKIKDAVVVILKGINPTRLLNKTNKKIKYNIAT